MDLLLLSNGMMPGQGYLAHAVEPIRSLLNGRQQALFIPFAGVTRSWDEYTAVVQQALAPLGISITGIHSCQDAGEAVKQAQIIIVGGGNTFHLVKHCRQRGLLQPIAARVRAGAGYIGWSAGANLACPTLCTTNDMPIVDPGGFDALGLIDVQINPHYTNKLPAGHQGETRQQRLAELLAARPEMRVIGLPEGDWLRVHDQQITLEGPFEAQWFHADRPEGQSLVPGHTVIC